ncbi:alpha/beta fold hydrolase [Nonomuraea sp. NPDC049152]|uniref:alpha/beta fold hydrolase n=1 Tax=Nonomuraea sp. NPDC049152 TaxID=3154350 RepID=UPI0033D6486B
MKLSKRHGGIRGRSRRLVIAVVVAALAVMSPTASAASDDGGLTWRACEGEGTPAGLQCAAIEVPVDWAQPDGRKITLDLARLPATEPAGRIGSVLSISGGYGIEDLSRGAANLTELRRRFDLIGFNIRTTVWITQMPEACKQPGAILHDPRSKKQYTAQAAAMTKALTTCQQADATGLFTHLDALSIARDVEAIRQALGEQRLSFTAHSLGGVAAAAYARLFPQRIRAMYVDSVGNQTKGWPAHHLQLLPVSQRMITRFAEWCADTPACALHGQDAEAVWRRLLRAADRHPIPVTSPQYGTGKLTGWLLGALVPRDPGPQNADWLTFATSVDKARRGDGSGFADAALFIARHSATPGALAMSCGDERGYTSYAQLEDFRRKARKIAPEYAGAEISLLGCTGWPLPVANPARPLPTRDLPPLLGVGTTWGGYPLTKSFTSMIPGSVTIAYDGPGHVTYLSGKKCPIRHATTYLTDLTLPKPGTTCPAEEPPAEHGGVGTNKRDEAITPAW